MDTSLSKLRELLMGREAWHAAVQEVAESDMTEQLNWSELNTATAYGPRALARILLYT